MGGMITSDDMRARWDNARIDELLDGMSRIEFMLRFTLSNPDLDTTIVGTKNVDHLRDNVEFAVRGPLPADLLAETRAAIAAAKRVAHTEPSNEESA